MSFLTADYSNTTSNTNEPLPAGDYEFIINSVQENATQSGAESIQFDLIVRNDLDQAMPNTNGKYHNRRHAVSQDFLCHVMLSPAHADGCPRRTAKTDQGRKRRNQYDCRKRHADTR